MDRARDVDELLANGYFRTARGRSPAKTEGSPAPANVPSFLQARHDSSSYQRSRSRGPSKPPPPRPIVEDEGVSLAKEQHVAMPSYDPPLRGIIEQNPIILEADISDAEAARLHKIPPHKEDDGKAERRFVFVPKSDANSSNSEDDARRREQKKRDSGKDFKQEVPVRERKEIPPPREVPPADRRTSRQDLPSLETKVPKELPVQYRRSASSYTSGSKVDSPKPSKTPEYFLSPDMMRGPKDTFKTSQSAPRYNTTDFGGRAATQSEKRNSGSFPSSRADTPSLEQRNSGNFESGRRSRKNSMEKGEKLTRPQQLSEEFSGRRPERPPVPERKSTTQSSRSSSRRYYSSSDEDLTDSDSDRQRRRKHQSSNLHPGDSRHQRSPSKSSSVHRPVKSGSKHTSPLPSPKSSQNHLPAPDNVERSGTFPVMKKGGSRPDSASGNRDQKLNPFEFPPPNSKPGSRHSSQGSFPIPIPMPMPPGNLMDSVGPLPIPNPSRVDMPSVDEHQKAPILPQYEDRSSAARPIEKPPWQPPKFEPPVHLEKPVGSYRRYSEDIERGSITPLATCPRKNYVRGRNDWLTLPQCPGFDICPSCYNSTMAPTEFRHMFVVAPLRSPDAEVICDFGSSPWYRIAWLLTRKDRRRDLNLFYSLAKVTSTVQPCFGSQEVQRQWYSIIDPKTGSPIRNFDVCYSCVKSIEVLLPSIRGIFVRTDAHTTSSTPRVCDLRFGSKRFVQYFDALETTADEADYSALPPDTRSLASLVRRLALVEECQKDMDLRDARWHIITQLPEFTVCPECFEEVVWPEISSRAQKAIPLMFNKTVQRLPKASCQLYSERMRDVFKMAVERDDYKYLAGKARERRKVEGGFKLEVAELKRALALNPGSRRIEGDIEKVTEEWRLWE